MEVFFFFFFLGGGGGGVEVMRALASYQSGLGSIPRLGIICGLSLLLIVLILLFPFSQK